MRVLLCSPFNQGPDVVLSGIGVWAHNLVEYYSTIESDIALQVIPFDRKTPALTKKSMLSRAITGVIEYRSAIKQTRNSLRNKKCDVLHLCTSASLSLLKDLLIIKMARKKGVKTVIHFHFGRIPDIAQANTLEWRLLKRVVSMSSEAIVMDKKSFETLERHGFKNVHYLPNPLSLSVAEQINNERVEREPNKLLFVGHVVPSKGIFELVEACKGITGIELHIVGSASEEMLSEIRGRIGGEEKDDWLVFHGEVAHEYVIKEMLSSQLFVLPTYTEGFPNVVIEAMACGCAIATTPVGAIPEMLDYGGKEPCGLFSEPKDVRGLKNNIILLLTDKEAAAQYARRATNRVNELFQVRTIWNSLISIWRQ